MTESTMPEVVVTGMGATTPLGGDVASSWKAILAGESGARTLENDWAEKYGIPVNFAASIKVKPEEVLERPKIKRNDPSGQYALIAAREAWADAGEPEVSGERLAVVVSSGIGGVWTLLDAWDTEREKGARRVLPLTVPMLMPNSPSAAVSLEFGARGGAHALVSACASGAEAINYGMELIRRGRVDVVIAGGTEAAIHPLPLAAFAKMTALSTRNDDPKKASRPYDVHRDGFVLGEGAGILILESAEHAAARGARVYARAAGAGMSSDGYDIAAPDPTSQGQIRAMKEAIADAAAHGVPLEHIVHVNAHATSTQAGDGPEAAAIVKALGPAAKNAWVSATKSMTGHLLGGAGAMESIFTILALRERLAPPTINIEELDPAITANIVRDVPHPLPATGQIAGMNNAFGFGGHNMATVFAVD